MSARKNHTPPIAASLLGTARIRWHKPTGRGIVYKKPSHPYYIHKTDSQLMYHQKYDRSWEQPADMIQNSRPYLVDVVIYIYSPRQDEIVIKQWLALRALRFYVGS